jgi:hypothetical protein
MQTALGGAFNPMVEGSNPSRPTINSILRTYNLRIICSRRIFWWMRPIILVLRPVVIFNEGVSTLFLKKVLTPFTNSEYDWL